jgi:hypothetical protein
VGEGGNQVGRSLRGQGDLVGCVQVAEEVGRRRRVAKRSQKPNTPKSRASERYFRISKPVTAREVWGEFGVVGVITLVGGALVV